MHVLDICDAVDLGVNWLRNNRGYQIINLGSGTATSVLQVINSFEHHFEIIVDYKIENSRRGEPDFLLSNIEKVNSLLKWKQKK